LSYRFRLVRDSFLQKDGLPFANALTEAAIQEAFEQEGVVSADADDDEQVYTPAVTLWAFLSQVLHTKQLRSCTAAVARVVTLLVVLGRKPCSANTGAYCRARGRLPEPALQRLVYQIADGCEQRVPKDWLWCGRNVKLVDGTTVSTADTPENQAAWPQPTTQEPGLGFPLVRLVVLFSLATGLLSGMALGPYAGKETGEPALLRELRERLQPGDVLLADRYYCSYFMIALLLEWGIDIVTRLHQRRRADFRRGQCLGPADHLVEWTRPAKPSWMDQASYDRMPPSIRLRELRVAVPQRGFRVRSLVIVTTLSDAETYTRQDLAKLYHQRWLVELDIRAIKTTLDLDLLRCKTPEMVRKELWVSLLAYNLIRTTIVQVAEKEGLSPRDLSFAGALQTIAANWTLVLVAEDSTRDLLRAAAWSGIGQHRVNDRPDRVEPRAVKRRPKQQAQLTKPRAEARADLLAGIAA
jgi:hypothetical protein